MVNDNGNQEYNINSLISLLYLKYILHFFFQDQKFYKRYRPKQK